MKLTKPSIKSAFKNAAAGVKVLADPVGAVRPRAEPPKPGAGNKLRKNTHSRTKK